VAMIGVAPFITLAKQEGAKVFEIRMQDLIQEIKTVRQSSSTTEWRVELQKRAREVVGEITDND
jgi:hypothetical protein